MTVRKVEVSPEILNSEWFKNMVAYEGEEPEPMVAGSRKVREALAKTRREPAADASSGSANAEKAA